MTNENQTYYSLIAKGTVKLVLKISAQSRVFQSQVGFRVDIIVTTANRYYYEKTQMAKGENLKS